MPEHAIRAALSAFKRRFRLMALADATIAGAACAGAVYVLTGTTTPAALAGGIVTVVVAVIGWRQWTDARVACALERRVPDFANRLVTAQEALAGRRVHAVVRHDLLEQTARRLDGPALRRWLPSERARIALAITALAATTLVIMSGGRGPAGLPGARDSAQDKPSAPERPSLRVTVVAPPYVHRPTIAVDDPVRVDVLEGSTVRLEMRRARGVVEAVEPGHAPEPFSDESGTPTLALDARTSRVLLIRQSPDTPAAPERFLQLVVHPDHRPVVRVERPARDLLFATPSGTIPIEATATDDFKVASLSLRYTRIAGSGETFTFEEGELPLQLTTVNGTTLQGAGTLVLDRLKLEDGDTLVYRALARDDKPGADPSASESFLVEIGKRAEALSAGFAVPEERDRQGLSQQMLIMKTERLHGERATLAPEALLERSRLLAVEQRMVRAEFLFMTGGEVVDEVEEAEQSDELTQGRLENRGQIELLNAIREMSRAEARLNAADTTQALVDERAALAALQKAFDRRRYFLRTLPERARIDPSRRFAGDASSARPRAATPPAFVPDPQVEALRDAMQALAAARDSGQPFDARLIARVITLDPDAPALQQFALRAAAGGSLSEATSAARGAEQHLAALLRRRLNAAAANQLERDALAGALADRLRRARGAAR